MDEESPTSATRTPCALCGEAASSPIYIACPDQRFRVPGLFDVVRCESCGLVRADPQPSARLIGRYYPDDYGPFATQEPPGKSRLQRRLAALVEAPYRLRYGSPHPVPEPVHRGARALDIGVGSGDFLKRLAASGWEPWGIEANPRAAEAARRRCGLPSGRIVVGRAEDAAFAPGTFDLITAHHVVEHLHDPLGVLSKARTWLSDDGRLVLTMPNVKSLESRVFGPLWFGLDLPRHLYH
ncbi:MAG: class I SAM-dependent methyltransferase, partial [Actinobacteria bacterium]|nr:class I SAM-dependent methyltransferase [Actinomycetota bacterium]